MSDIEALSKSEPFAFMVALNPHGIALMTRDMELIRKILTKVQSRHDMKLRPVEIDGYEAWIVDRHVELLIREGYLEGHSKPSSQDQSVFSVVADLTWAGHDFLAALENETVWAKMKQLLSPTDLASLPLSIMRKVSLGILETYIMHKVGLS